jgi:hypothetical protein
MEMLKQAHLPQVRNAKMTQVHIWNNLPHRKSLVRQILRMGTIKSEELRSICRNR